MRPHFSVVIPVHDGADVIGRAVASVLAQTFADLEVIVVDEGSADESVDAVRAVSDGRVRIMRRDHESLDAARRAGIRAARGRWVALLDAHDEAMPGWLARIGRLHSATGARLISCGGEQHHAHGSVTPVAPTHVEGLGGTQLSSRPGAFAARRQDLLVVLDGHRGAAPTMEMLVTELAEVLLVDGCEIVATPEMLVRWYEPRDSDEPEPSTEPELRLTWALQSLDALAQTPIPDPDQIVRAATIGGIAAVCLGDMAEARRMFRLARQIEPCARTIARCIVAACPPLARRVWLHGPDDHDSADHSLSDDPAHHDEPETRSPLAVSRSVGGAA